MSYFYNCGRYLIRDHSGDSFGLCVLLGIDTSARLISLAINIALMGYILIEGILSSLRSTFSRSLDAPQLRSLAERIAAGDVVSLKQGFPGLASLDSSRTLVHAALVHGFGLVMVYGCIGAWVLAVASFVMFGPRARVRLTSPVV